MLRPTLWHVLRSVLVVLAILTAASAARAQGARRAGSVRLETASGARGPVELRPDGDGYSGEIVIVNEGKEPLVVSRIAPRGETAGSRVAPKLAVRVASGTLPITLAPGASRSAIVHVSPSPRQRQLFGQVVVTTSDERSGEVAMGLRAQVPGPLGSLEPHLLSLLVGLPLLGAIVAFALRAAGRRDDRGPRRAALAALGLQVLLAAYVYRGFIPDLSRADGNDGLQFVERVVWIRGLFAELYLGVDGVAATSLFVTSLVAFLAALAEPRAGPEGAGYHAALLVLDAALLGAISAMDGLLFLLFSSIAVVVAGLLVGAWGSDGRRAAAMRLLVSGTFAITLLAVALFAIGREADPTFLVDGTKVTMTMNLPELSRVALDAKGSTLLGAPLVKVAFVLVMIASLHLLAAFPAHRWLSDVLASAPPATGILVATALPTIGLCAFLRVGCAVLPEGMRWAAGVVVALGAISAAYGALLALGEGDLRRLAACATTAQAGFVLLGAGSLTPQGLSGAIVVGSTRAVACGLLLLLASAVHARLRTVDASRLGGVAQQMPGWAAALAIAALGQAGVLGLGGAWGPLLALLGVLPGYAPLAIAAALALAVLAAAHLGPVSRVAFAPADPRWTDDPALEPLGGRLPDLTPREWMSVAPLAAVVVVLGLWPAPVLSTTAGTVRDLASAVSPPGPDQVATR